MAFRHEGGFLNRVWHALPGVRYHQEHRRRTEWDRVHPHHPFPQGQFNAGRAAVGAPPAPGLHWVPYTGWVDQNGHPVNPATAGGVAPPGGAVAPPAVSADIGSEFGGAHSGGHGGFQGGHSGFLAPEGWDREDDWGL